VISGQGIEPSRYQKDFDNEGMGLVELAKEGSYLG